MDCRVVWLHYTFCGWCKTNVEKWKKSISIDCWGKWNCINEITLNMWNEREKHATASFTYSQKFPFSKKKTQQESAGWRPELMAVIRCICAITPEKSYCKLIFFQSLDFYHLPFQRIKYKRSYSISLISIRISRQNMTWLDVWGWLLCSQYNHSVRLIWIKHILRDIQ